MSDGVGLFSWKGQVTGAVGTEEEKLSIEGKQKVDGAFVLILSCLVDRWVPFRSGCGFP